MEYDIQQYVMLVTKILDNRLIDAEKFDNGENISSLSEVKIIFENYGVSQNESGEYVEDKNLENYVLFVHKDSVKRNFQFPEHDLKEINSQRIIQHRDNEILIETWRNVETGRWSIAPLSDSLKDANIMSETDVMTTLQRLYDKYYS
jgi:hypothetical protein